MPLSDAAKKKVLERSQAAKHPSMQEAVKLKHAMSLAGKTTPAKRAKPIPPHKQNGKPKVSHNHRAVKRTKTHSLFGHIKGMKHEAQKTHSIDAIHSMIEMATITGDAAAAARLMEADATWLQTQEGQFALHAVSKLSESEKAYSHFLDIELVEGVPVMYFTKPQVGTNLKEEIEKALSDFGKIEVLASPGDKIGEGMESDLLIVAMELSTSKVESFIDAALDTLSEEVDVDGAAISEDEVEVDEDEDADYSEEGDITDETKKKTKKTDDEDEDEDSEEEDDEDEDEDA